MMLAKYWQVTKTSWENGFVYRLNFLMWRVRAGIWLLTVYFLWGGIFQRTDGFLSYDKAAMMTYILGTGVLATIVFSTRSIDVGTEIAEGDLSNYLLKPVNYFAYWFSRDLADKLLNILFVIGEIGLIIFFLRPPLIMPTASGLIAMFLLVSILALVLYFIFSFLVSAFTFWYPEHNGWPIRFFVFVLLEFLAGGLFPLDILPPVVFSLLRLLPPAYFMYYPLQVFLGRLSFWEGVGVVSGLIFWIFLLAIVLNLVWRRGIKVYEAYGR